MTPKAGTQSIFAGIVGFVVGLGFAMLAGCSPGSQAPPPPGLEDDPDRDMQLGILCQAELSITGSFVASAPQPPDVFGCWPVGTWTFSAQVVDHNCDQEPTLLPEYQFSASRDADDNESYSYLTDPSYERVRLGVTSGGGGLCEGSVEVYSPDGKVVVNLKPALQADGSITGNGEYELYGSDQW